jgi:transposase
VLVDTQGHVLAVKVTGAQRSDQEGGRALLSPLAHRFPRMQLLWGDSHYGGHFLTWMKVNLGWRVQIVKALTAPKRGILVAEGEEVDWETCFPQGFRPLPRRWVVERTFSTLVRFRRLCRDHEGLPESSEAFIMLAASVHMFTRLAPRLPT